MVAYIPLLASVAGALVYGLVANAKLQELGRITFGAGAFALLFAMAERTVSLLR